MSNIRLFYPESLSLNLTTKLDKMQSHYVNKVMRVKRNEVFSLFNSNGEWEAKINDISKNKELSFGEQKILENAFNRLVKELAASSKSNEETIYSQVKKLLTKDELINI